MLVVLVWGEQIVQKWQNLSTFQRSNQKLLGGNCNLLPSQIPYKSKTEGFRPRKIKAKGRELGWVWNIWGISMNAHLLSSLPVPPPARVEVLNRPWKLNCIAVTVILLGSFTAYQRLQVLRKLYFSEYLVYARMNRLFLSFIIAMTVVVKCKKAI